MSSSFFQEVCASVSPSSAGFSNKSGKSVRHYRASNDYVTDSPSIMQQLLGGVQPAGDGSLARALPCPDPQFPSLFCDNVSDIRGWGKDWTLQDADDSNEDPLGVYPITQYALYPEYRLQVEFVRKPYVVIPDRLITVGKLTYTDEFEATHNRTYATEWFRFTDYEILPAVEFVTAQQGQMLFVGSSAAAPTGIPFTGAPKIRLPKGSLKIKWYQVPSAYLDTSASNITQWLGRVNQNAFFGYAPGQLLYVGALATRYTPPFPRLVKEEPDISYYSNDKWVDFEFLFEVTERTTPSPPTVINPNYIVGGHNLAPWFSDRNYYYVQTNNLAEAPTYFSFPVELLFTDPTVL